MLTETIMHDCLFKLLRSSDEDSLECLCQLLMTIGQELDNKQSKVQQTTCVSSIISFLTLTTQHRQCCKNYLAFCNSGLC